MQMQRLNLTYSVVWDGLWHVGSGFRTAATDRLIQRQGGRDGKPFLPGSQIKGVLRHTCERLALALGLEAVDPHATSPDQRQQLVAHFKPLRHTTLIVDRLFGTRFQGDCLFVDNAVAKLTGDPDDDTPATTSIVRARTAMDRVTRTVKEGHLFTTELADQRLRLQGSIRARHASNVLTRDDDGFPYEYSLLVAGLLSIDAFGGDKSTGLGRCRMTLDEVTWNSQQRTPDECLATFEEADWKLMIEMLREGHAQ
ncbi:MAG: RAMP superfamily CRISPR-associated protein [Candidatus Paceibacterota bacterium]